MCRGRGLGRRGDHASLCVQRSLFRLWRWLRRLPCPSRQGQHAHLECAVRKTLPEVERFVRWAGPDHSMSSGRLSHRGGKGAFGCLFHTSLPEMPDSGVDARNGPAKGAQATDLLQHGTHMEPNGRAGFRA